MKMVPSCSGKQSYEEYRIPKANDHADQSSDRFSDVFKARAARKKENLSLTSADADKKYVEFKCHLNPDGGPDNDPNVYKMYVRVLSTTSSVIEYCEFREELSHLWDAKGVSNDNNADENARKRFNLALTCMRDNALIEFKAIHERKTQANNALPQANRRAYRVILREVFREFAKKCFLKPDQDNKVQECHRFRTGYGWVRKERRVPYHSRDHRPMAPLLPVL
jgi:hypothetical protein